jgi:hypothetical protein
LSRAASRVVVLVLMPGRRPYTRSRVRLTEDLELYSGQRDGVPSAQALTVLGMAPRCRDGGTALGMAA